MKNSTIGILGAGAWGTAIAKVLAGKGLAVDLWCYEEEVAEDIHRNRRNDRYLLGVDLPSGIRPRTDLRETASGKEYLLVTSPSLYTIDIIKQILTIEDIVEGNSLIGIMTKGFIATKIGPQLPLAALEEYLPGSYKGSLSFIAGPSHAEEVAREKLTGLVSASLKGKNSIRMRKLLTSKSLVVFSSFDVIGVQICSAAKNIIAIAFGILDALMEFSDNFGDNTESLLLAAGLNEIQLLGQAMGASHPETFSSLAGVGDLEVTCRSRYGRNRRFGREIVLDRKIDSFSNIEEIIDRVGELGYFPEGLPATKYAMNIAAKHSLKLPIISGVYRILNKEIEALDAVETMLGALQKDFFSAPKVGDVRTNPSI